MNEHKIYFYFSEQRLATFRRYSNDDFSKSLDLYRYNIELSEALYPVLSILEVVLRNAINETLKRHFNDLNWFKNSLPSELENVVIQAQNKLQKRNVKITPDNIIAELHFGFWNMLFSRNFAILFWKPLRLIFKNLPKQQKKREYVSTKLNTIRLIRNRIYHYEPIINDLILIEKQYNDIYMFLNWIDYDIAINFISKDKFSEILQKIKSL